VREARRRGGAIALPAIDTPEGVAEAQALVIREAAADRLSTRKACDLSELLDNVRRALATRDLGERIRALERINAERAEKEDGRR
jgi:hypothetical protein